MHELQEEQVHHCALHTWPAHAHMTWHTGHTLHALHKTCVTSVQIWQTHTQTCVCCPACHKHEAAHTLENIAWSWKHTCLIMSYHLHESSKMQEVNVSQGHDPAFAQQAPEYPLETMCCSQILFPCNNSWPFCFPRTTIEEPLFDQPTDVNTDNG